MHSFKRAKDPEPENGFIIISSESSFGIPKNDRTGAKTQEKSVASPLILKSSTAINIATKYGKVLVQILIDSFAPVVKYEYAGRFFIMQNTNKIASSPTKTYAVIFCTEP